MIPDLVPPPDAAPLAAPDAALTPLDQSPAAVYLAQLAPSGRRTMQQALGTLAQLLRYDDPFSCPWWRLRYQHTAALRSVLADRYAPATVNKMLNALRRVLEEAWRLGLMTVEEYQRAANVKPIKGERLPAGRALSLAEITALLEACAADSSALGVRDAAIIAVMAAGGPRRSEVVALTRADYTPADGCLRVRQGKGAKDRTLYVAGGAKTALDDWLTLRGEAPGALFCSTTQPGCVAITAQAILVLLRKRARAAGVASFSPHDLRRTMITQLLEHGADVVSVQRLAGHADPATTAKYDRRGEHAKRDAAAKLELPHIPNVARRTLPLDD